jgi:hypothetical protein
MSERVPTRIPLVLGATWVSRYWTMTPPRYDPHTAWSVRVAIAAEMPLRLVRLVENDLGQSISKSSERGCEFTFEIGDATEVGPTPARSADPWRALGISAPVAATTWSVIPMSASDDGQARISLFAVARQDTETLRGGRWRIREQLWRSLPVASDLLRQGQRGSYWPVAVGNWQQNGNIRIGSCSASLIHRHSKTPWNQECC